MRACNPTRLARAPPCPLPRDQLPVPPKNRVGRHEGRDSAQHTAAQAMAEFREAPTLVVLETQPTSLKTDSQHSISLRGET